MINIASYASYEYLDKILALFNSIKKYKNVEFHLLALDQKIYNFIKKKKIINCYHPKILKINFNENFAQNMSIGRLNFVKYLFVVNLIFILLVLVFVVSYKLSVSALVILFKKVSETNVDNPFKQDPLL